MNKFIKACLFAITIFIAKDIAAQDSLVASKEIQKENKNIIKINLSGFVWKNISLQYERKISKRYSFALNAHYIPFGHAPFESLVENIIGDPSVKVNQFKMGNYGIAPEFRFYVGKKGALRGFYIGPFASFNYYNTDFPLNYSNDTKTGVFSGSLTAYTFGLQFGAQFKLSKHVYLDWWIIGPNIGTANGDFTLATPLSASDQLSVKDEIENLNNSLPLKVVESFTVNAAGAKIIAKGPWGGIRGLGINLGYRF